MTRVAPAAISGVGEVKMQAKNAAANARKSNTAQRRRRRPCAIYSRPIYAARTSREDTPPNAKATAALRIYTPGGTDSIEEAENNGPMRFMSVPMNNYIVNQLKLQVVAPIIN